MNAHSKTAVLKTASDVIDALGGTSATAELFQVSSSAVSNWRKEGFPRALHLRLYRTCERRGIKVDPAVFPSSDAA